MPITEEYIGKSGVKYIFEYEDADSFDHLPLELCKQTYGVCFYMCLVEPYGEFISDPDGGITEIKLIEPTDYKQYFDWAR